MAEYPVLQFVDTTLKKVARQYGIDSIEYAVNEITDVYRKENLGSNTDSASIPFHLKTYRAAYLYRFFLANEGATKFAWRYLIGILGNFREYLKGLGRVNFVSLGSGPATDLFVFHQILEQYDLQINATIFDNNCQGWIETVDMLFNTFKVSETVTQYCYLHFDFFGPISDDLIENLANADFISLVKFISCVSFNEKFAINRLKEYFGYLRKGAFVFFMDNSGGKAVKIMETAATDSGLECQGELIHFIYDVDCKTDILNRWKIRFGHRPQTTAKITASLWYK